MTANENDIHVEVEVPAPDPAPETPEAPAVVVVNDAPPAETATTDGVLAALLEITSRLERLENATMDANLTAIEADIKAETALQADAEIQAEVAEAVAEVQEALEEDQAPAEADEAPKKSHWLHR